MPRLSCIEQALAWAQQTLARVSDSEPLDALLLLAHVLEVTRPTLIAHPEHPLNAAQDARFQELITRRTDGTPIAYLLGTRSFYDRAFHVTPDVLIPRPETEHLIELALQWAAEHQIHHIADVGTGSGAIAVILAAHLHQAHVSAIDVSAAALDVARMNADRYHLQERITFIQGDLLVPLQDDGTRLDLIAANLPYIPTPKLEALAVTAHEPLLALDGGADGLDLIRRLLKQAPTLLNETGLILLEIEAGQGSDVAALIEQAFPGSRVKVHPDYAGHDRVVSMERTA